jgi:hypothetical protein
MRRTPVQSSNIRSIGYDPENKLLEIEFTSGWIYHFSRVPPQVHSGLMRASSHGRYFAHYIKKVYPYRRTR